VLQLASADFSRFRTATLRVNGGQKIRRLYFQAKEAFSVSGCLSSIIQLIVPAAAKPDFKSSIL